MGLASLILGIISLVMSFIPGVGIIFCVTAIVGIILGIISLCKKMDKGKSIAGIITSSIAIVITVLYIIGLVIILSGDNGIIERAIKTREESSSSEVIPQTETCFEGEKFQNEEIAITFVSADQDFKGYSEYAKVKDGYKIIKAEFEFENIGTSNQYISSYDFDCYADGYNCDSFWSVEDSSFSTTLSTGKKAKGIVYFEVPENSDSITLEYDLNSWDYETVEFIVK